MTTSALVDSNVLSICGRYFGAWDRSLSIWTTNSAPAAIARVIPST